ncbi:hypothetical protein [Nocardioides sp. InS609-2]|uniref:hypothetical protein n=1 Tax=Nocardioides sp. InS609-2 TaxID=2760705 RepID=UPI0017D84361|nr:hypothetical protein [Nocardioides sp. InS609-2]MBA3781768.1 hypothetical protein [Nocardioides sp.]
MNRLGPGRLTLLVGVLLATSACANEEAGQAAADKESVDAATRQAVPALAVALAAEPPGNLHSMFYECGGGYGVWTYQVGGQMLAPSGGRRKMSRAVGEALRDLGWTTAVRDDLSVAGDREGLTTLVQIPQLTVQTGARVVDVRWGGPSCVNYAGDDEPFIEDYEGEDFSDLASVGD